MTESAYRMKRAHKEEKRADIVKQRRILLALTFALTITSCQMPLRSSNAEPIASSEIYVIDADTIRVRDQPPNVRLVGFNAPETWRAACPAEQLQGDKAARRLRELVRAGKLDFEFIACSCPAGTQGTPACNYGRNCGVLKASGRDVGEILIAEGLAVPFMCSATRCPPTPRPWCASAR
jgi:endonuclease YncB( thermonuclease family)